MIGTKEIRGLAERLAKADTLVESGAVFPVNGLAGHAVVRNGNGDSMYLVRFDAGHESCTCPDFQHRQREAGQPCKHILAAQIHQERADDAWKEVEPIVEMVERAFPEIKEGASQEDEIVAQIQRLRGRLSIAWLNGEEDEADRLTAEIERTGKLLPSVELNWPEE